MSVSLRPDLSSPATTAAFLLAVVLIGGLVALSITREYQNEINQTKRQLQAKAALLLDHAEQSIGDANKLLSAIDGPVAEWDLKNPEQGHQIFELMRRLIRDSPQLAAAWIVDASGTNVLDSWTFPSPPRQVSTRPYFRKHAEGAKGPVITGRQVGSVNGKERFTLSRDVRDSSGQLRAVMVVAIYTRYFSDLYRHLAEGTGTRAGIFLAGPPSEDAILARLGANPSSEQFINQLNIKVLLGSSGSGVLDDAGEARLASWAASERFPPLFAASSETLSDVLATWRTQALELTGLAVIAVSSFGAFLLFASRASRARAAASRNELLLREVHHRVKNNLQLVSALVDMRARRVIHQETRTELEQVKTQVMAFANVYEILQISPDLDHIEFSGLLKSLCTALETGSRVKLSVATEDDLLFAPQIALSLCIVCNELLTNALKHARSETFVRCQRDGGQLMILIADDGSGLPEGFSVSATQRFGLRMAIRLASDLGGTITSIKQQTGACLELRVPIDPAASRPGPMRDPHPSGPHIEAPKM
jgi:two-component sensor histidine kinase